MHPSQKILATSMMASPRVVRWKVTLLAHQYYLKHSPAIKQKRSNALSKLPVDEQEEAVVQTRDTLHMKGTVDHMGTKAAQIREWSAKDPVVAAKISHERFG